MVFKLKIRQKIQLFILSTVIAIFIVTIGYISLSARRMATSSATALTDARAEESALNIEGKLNAEMSIVRTFSQAFLEYHQLTSAERKSLYSQMYLRVLEKNPQIDAIWDSWELSNLDPTWTKPYGREFFLCWREDGEIKTKAEIRSLTGDPPHYAAMKAAGVENIAEPYISEVQKGGLMTTLVSPMFEKGKYIGLIGIDLLLTRFQEYVNQIKPFENSYAFMVSAKGMYIAFPDTSYIGKNINDFAFSKKLNEKYKLLDKIQKGENFNLTVKNENGEEYYYSVSPINVGQTGTPWALAIAVPMKAMLSQANHAYNVSIITGIIGLLILILVIFLLSNSITSPISMVTKSLGLMSTGKVDRTMRQNFKTGDEIDDMTKALNISIDGLVDKAEFALEIGQGNLNVDLNLLSNDDILGKALLNMRDSLLKAEKDEEERKSEEAKVQWANKGLASFTEILRQSNETMEVLADNILKHLVRYLNAIQGGVFIKNDDNSHNIQYDLVAAFAFDRKKYLTKSYEEAEGLVGACAAEKATIYLTEIPQNYIEVTSGLGDANPNVLLLVPLKVEDTILGVIEIASFYKMQKHEIEFVEKIAQNIGSTIQTVRINEKTKKLLEQSQQQAEIMAAQEEEMRQNMEELQATQEESARKGAEMEGLVNALNASSYVAEYDPHGNVINVNDAFANLLGSSREEVIGTHHIDGIDMASFVDQSYEEFWNDLLRGKIKKHTTHLKMHGKSIVLLETYTPIVNEHGEVSKILKISTDVTDIHSSR
ncbi:MAG TPA: cache domain-containing protein [Williamwhitmania sp.]|nr:cache domain-containing protein [Williamwhitmania sp.]